MEFTKKNLNKTLWIKPTELEKQRKWYKVDATWKILWRLATDIAKKLLWKDKAYYNDFSDVGDFIVVENAQLIKVTGNKLEDKLYYTYSGYKGNLKTKKLGDVLQKNPTQALTLAVRGMLSKNKLRDKRMKRLKIIAWTSTRYDNFKPVNLYK